MPTTRRFVLFSTAALLAGCAGTDALPVVQQDTDLLMAGLRHAGAALIALGPGAVPSSIVATVQDNMAQAVIFAGDVDTAVTAAQAVAPVRSLAQLVGDALVLLEQRPLPPSLRELYAACGALLVAIQQEIGLVAGPATPAAAFYTPAQARLILRQAG